MSALFVLDVETEAATRRATLRLGDAEGHALETWEVVLDEHPASRWSALFDTRRHVERMRGVEAPEAQLAELGRFLGEQVLGPGMARRLAEGLDQRTLLIRLPDPESDRLAAAFARVPWELARAPGDDRTLLDRNVVVRAAPAGAKAGREKAIALEEGKPVRVLLVFAEAPGSRPLAGRLERERLLDLFFEEVMPSHNVEVDVLCHGVTRARLRDQVRARGGYHVVHWSGHGNVDALELALDEGEKAAPRISGQELIDLFHLAGGFIPSVVFLGACHSGSQVHIADWASLRASLLNPERAGDREGSTGIEAALEMKSGFTGTALVLVREGVRQVVAMRYEVGDRYARRLAKRFYRGLLAEKAHHAADVALSLAKNELARDEARASEYEAVDHANPLVFGSVAVKIEPPKTGSAQRGKRSPRSLLQGGSKELDPPDGFVGRGEDLTRLSRRWLRAKGSAIALIQGLAGLGKTSLAAEIVHLWFDRFDHVLAFQFKSGALSIEDFYGQIDQRLTLMSPLYRERCEKNENVRVCVDPVAVPDWKERRSVLAGNLIDVLCSERVLLLLDNFDTNLLVLTKAGPDGYSAQDPEWDRLLKALSERLCGAGSRLLITSRHKVAALANSEQVMWIHLGPLPIAEAKLFFEGQRPIRGLLYGDDEEQCLAKRILDISRGHPLILARVADLARMHHGATHDLSMAWRKALGEALDKIQGQGYKVLPDVFVGTNGEKERELEYAYLNDVAIGAVDLLIERLSAEGRRLLWAVTRVGEPLPAAMIHDAPGGVLDELCETGLLVREGDNYSFHELVAERATEWMLQHPEASNGLTETEVWMAYGTLYGVRFKALCAAGKRDLASEAGRRGIRYLVRARAFEHLGNLAIAVVNSTRDPALLRQVIVDLQSASTEVPEGKVRWNLQACLADALNRAGRPDKALPLYAMAAKESEVAECWGDLSLIYRSWANAFGNLSQFDRAREAFVQAADTARRGGSPRVDIIASELEALRIDVIQGHPGEALLAINTKLDEVRAWWEEYQQGKIIIQASDSEALMRTLLDGLDTAHQANLGLERWQVSLDLLGELEQVQQLLGTGVHELARTRLSRCRPLTRLGRLNEAKAVLENCLDVYRQIGDIAHQARALSALADVWDELGDPTQSLPIERLALALRERLPDPRDRAMSHNNLAGYLYAKGLIDEAKWHQFADLVYCLTAGLDSRAALRNLGIRVRLSFARGEDFVFPRLVELLANPAFDSVRAFVDERGVAVVDVQAIVDRVVEQCCIKERDFAASGVVRISGITLSGPTFHGPRRIRLSCSLSRKVAAWRLPVMISLLYTTSGICIWMGLFVHAFALFLSGSIVLFAWRSTPQS